MLVKIVFYDHTEGGEGPLLCVVYGRVMKETDLFYQVVAWDVLDVNQDTVVNNRDVYNILKSTIVAFDELLYKREVKRKMKKDKERRGKK